MQTHDLRSGEALFWTAYPAVKTDPVIFGRIDGFLRLYGFCRNLAFVALIGAVLFAVKAIQLYGTAGWSDDVIRYSWWTVAALLLGAGMLHRYLKFYRLFAVEVLSTFAEHLRKETAP